MFKYCGFNGYKSGISLVTSLLLFTPISLFINEVRITLVYAQFYKLIVRLFVHIKYSLTVSVGRGLSTISTEPTITITKLKFNYLYIKDWSRMS